MRRTGMFTTGLIAATWLVLSLGAPLEAHQLVSSASIGITVHVEPDDSPIAGEPAQINISISNNDWPLENCDCWLYINDADGNNLRAVSWLVGGNINAVDYTFEQAGRYGLAITGQPWYYLDDQTAFEPFSAEFEIEVLPDPGLLARYGWPVAATLGLFAAGAWLGLRLVRILRQNKELR